MRPVAHGCTLLVTVDGQQSLRAVPVLTLPELARLAGVGVAESTLRRWADSGRLGAIGRVGATRVVPAERRGDVERRLRELAGRAGANREGD